MQLINKESSWFLSPEGENEFSQLNTLEERTVFIFSYLKTTVSSKIDDNCIFKLAFLFADAIYSSEVAYAKYPDMIDVAKNPFLEYFCSVDYTCDEFGIYCVLLAILHGKANPYDKSDWIYNSGLFVQKYDAHIDLSYELETNDMLYADDSTCGLGNPKAYEIEDKYKYIQAEIVWLFGEKTKKYN